MDQNFKTIRQQIRAFVFVFPENWLINIYWYPLCIINIKYLLKDTQEVGNIRFPKKGRTVAKGQV